MGTIKTSIQVTDGFSSAFKSMNNALGVVMSSLANTQKALGKPIDLTSVNQAQQDLARVAKQFDRMEKEAKQAANGQDKLNKSMNEGSTAAGTLFGKVKGLIGAYAGFQGASMLISGSDTFTNINSRLDLMNDGLQTTSELSNLVWESANRTFSSFQDTADAVGKLGIQAADAFTNSQDVINFAEQLNKHIAIAGTDGAATQGAMIQMVQAMSNGVLRGEELNSVMDGMPTVAKVIREEFARMGDTRGIKEIAEEGLITADIVKRALYNAADETNKKFNEMGVTFSDVWKLFRNHADRALEPVYKRLGAISNSKDFQNLARVAGQAFGLIAQAIVGVMWVVSALFGFIQRNADFVVPVLGAVAAAFIAQGVAALWAKRQVAINAAMMVWKTVCDWAATAAIIAMEFAQHGLNAALALCPLSWIIGLIIVLIAAVYLGVAAFNRLAGTSVSATGIIAGAFGALYAYIYNVIVNLANQFIIFAEFLINVFSNPIYAIKALFVNFAVNFLDACISMTKGWDGFATSFANAMISAVNFVIGAWNKLIDLLPEKVTAALGLSKGSELSYSTSITSDLTSARDSLKGMLNESKPENYTTLNRLEFKDVGGTAGKAYDWGASIANGVTDSLGSLMGSANATKELGSSALLANAAKNPAKGYGGANNPLDKIAANTGKTAKNTGATMDALTATDEELKYLRDIGEREAINKFTTAEIKLDVSNNNNINSELDLDGIINSFTSKLRDAMFLAAEGSHI